MVAELLRQNPTLDDLRQVAAHCKACDLWKTGTQTVFGEGVATAKVMFVGEQPGDREDLAGRPFVGPAGLLLDRALAQAGIERSEVYVTNVVKHFKWVRDERGKRRIHKKPRASEINACRPWLDAEIALVKPEVLVCLGATAAQSLLGRDFSKSLTTFVCDGSKMRTLFPGIGMPWNAGSARIQRPARRPLRRNEYPSPCR